MVILLSTVTEHGKLMNNPDAYSSRWFDAIVAAGAFFAIYAAVGGFA